MQQDVLIDFQTGAPLWHYNSMFFFLDVCVCMYVIKIHACSSISH